MPSDRIAIGTIAEFKDAEGRPCSIQQEDLFGQPAVWIGKRGHRIRLTQEQMKDLLPHLQRFAIEGKM